MSNVDTGPIALSAIKRGSTNKEQRVIFSTGIEAIVRPVAPDLVNDAIMEIDEPAVPTFTDEHGRVMENPTDPQYAIEKHQYELAVNRAALDVVIIMGVDLVDGLPEDDSWLKKLRYLERKGRIDLTEYNLEDPLDLEYLYKAKVAMGAEDIASLARYIGVGEQEVAAAERVFQGN